MVQIVGKVGPEIDQYDVVKESCNFSKRFNNISLNQTSSKSKIAIGKNEYFISGHKIPSHLNPRFLTIKSNEEPTPL